MQKQIKSIRTQYTRDKQKVGKRKSGDGLDDVYVSKWPHFVKLKFLDDFITAKPSASNFKVKCNTTYTQNTNVILQNIYIFQN